jgi:hypothetical protein
MAEPAAVVNEISRRGLAELHTHLGGSVDPAVMWTLAHEQGIALPVKDYWAFVDLVTVDPHGVDGLPQLDAIYKWTELIQSSPLAVERSVHGAIGGPYRKQNITTLELRFNPTKRNRGGERDLDHIIMAARGLDRARLEYPPVGAGLIVMTPTVSGLAIEHPSSINGGMQDLTPLKSRLHDPACVSMPHAQRVGGMPPRGLADVPSSLTATRRVSLAAAARRLNQICDQPARSLSLRISARSMNKKRPAARIADNAVAVWTVVDDRGNAACSSSVR